MIDGDQLIGAMVVIKAMGTSTDDKLLCVVVERFGGIKKRVRITSHSQNVCSISITIQYSHIQESNFLDFKITEGQADVETEGGGRTELDLT